MLATLVLAPFPLLLVGGIVAHGGAATGEGRFVDQQVPFSHRHHVVVNLRRPPTPRAWGYRKRPVLRIRTAIWMRGRRARSSATMSAWTPRPMHAPLSSSCRLACPLQQGPPAQGAGLPLAPQKHHANPRGPVRHL